MVGDQVIGIFSLQRTAEGYPDFATDIAADVSSDDPKKIWFVLISCSQPPGITFNISRIQGLGFDTAAPYRQHRDI